MYAPSVDPGRAYLFLGSKLVSATAFTNADANAFFYATGKDLIGLGVASGADLNGDTFDDILIGAPDYLDVPPNLTGNKGNVYIFNGSATGITGCNVRTTPTCPNATLTGMALDGLGYLGTPYRGL
jgi:hypothetical protein